MGIVNWVREQISKIVDKHGAIKDFRCSGEDLIVTFRDGHEQAFVTKPDFGFEGQETPMIEFGILAAQEEKWRRGQIKYGGTNPTNPLAHMYEELIDAMNYNDNAQYQQQVTPAEHQIAGDLLRVLAGHSRNRYFEVINGTFKR